MGQADRNTWMDLKLQGWSYGRIAKDAGVSRQRVQQILSPPKAIRGLVAKRADYRCETCAAPLGHSGHVHHAAGDNPQHYEEIDQLQYLCQTCHWHAHGQQQQSKGPTDVIYIRVPPAIKQRLVWEARTRHTTMQALIDKAIALLFQSLDTPHIKTLS